MKTEDFSNLMALLENNHDFPDSYTFKFVIPKVSEAEAESIFCEHSILKRESKGGKYLSLTFDIEAQCSLEIVEIYKRAQQIKGLLSL